MNSQDTFDTIVIGSGFGGSVMTYRLSQAGQEVCLLERGKAYPPGSFERSPAGLRRAVWSPDEGRHGLFDIWTFRGIDAVVSSGLGGGSLIYANVLLRKPPDWFVQSSNGGEDWPISYRELQPHYLSVERIMGVAAYPYADPGYAIPKVTAFRQAVNSSDLHWEPARLAVSFANGYATAHPGEPLAAPSFGNVHDQPGRPPTVRLTCRLCGECDIGCNYGSKNSLDHTYLSLARNKADIRVLSEVREIEYRDGGYVVRYVRHDPDNAAAPTPHEVRAPRVVLAAGALGSTYLLLRNQRAGNLPGLAPPQPGGPLGTRFSGNGDFLALALRAKRADGSSLPLDADRGPVVTGAAEVPFDPRDPRGRGYYIEDGGYPAFVDWLTEGVGFGLPGRAVKFGIKRFLAWAFANPDSSIGSDFADLIGPATLTSSSLPLLGMGRDVPDGTMYLRGRDNDYLGIDWNRRSSRAYHRGLRDALRQISDRLGATYRDTPQWRYLRRITTVHPLGGAPMGRDPSRGVVDRHGQAFGQDGLFVVDGAAMPGAVGPNPSLTIAAFADWSAEAIISGATER
ncbi:GMC family oxidoreductase [Actinoplanes sp. KI2]|uniref:GMC oxidoreductase n=1 Tax=Actinoplanes sp. KI2 TaxID=2983315 RepID=UPI0021D5AC87|nr:GMC family oxidoreductase [Actinoplanes sp. KI2]MCU7725957.1 GMC family oxidoreductase [Actinoplanes sp. KI2]